MSGGGVIATAPTEHQVRTPPTIVYSARVGVMPLSHFRHALLLIMVRMLSLSGGNDEI
jgi:hypothetical protein